MLLLAAFAATAFTAAWDKGVSFDEGLQLAVGYNLWLHDDYRIEGANGDFVKRWATLPYLISRPAFVARDDERWRRVESYALGRAFLFELGNRPEVLLRQARAMMVVLGVATGLLVFWWARDLFGAPGGFLALALYATSSHLIAFSGIVSTDLSISLALLGSTLGIWRLLHRITAGWLVFSLGFQAMLVLAKMTGVIIWPVAALLLGVKLGVGRPLQLEWRGRVWEVRSRRPQAAVFGGLILLHAVVGWAAIWAHYGFRYAAAPPAEVPAETAPVPGPAEEEGDGHPGPLRDGVRAARALRLLPEGYCAGLEYLLGHDDNAPAFMRGDGKLGGWKFFFPYAIWVKTQPSLFLLLLLGGIGGWVWRGRAGAGGAGEKRGAYAVIPLGVLVAVYLGCAIAEDFNVGHRHVLPLYPALYILAGAAAVWWRGRLGWVALGVGGLLVWRVAEVAAQHPHHLAYFGPQAGGPGNGYTHLVDSSIDWGMDLPGLKRWLGEHNPANREPLYLAYFGTDSVSHHGIKAVRLPSFHPRRRLQNYALAPGYYAISATLLQGNYLPTYGRWNEIYERIYQEKYRSIRRLEEAAADPGRLAALLQSVPPHHFEDEYRIYDYFRFGRLCAWLRRRGAPPQHHVGYSILIWKLTLADLQAALLGPPPELAEPPPEWLPARGRSDIKIEVSARGHAYTPPGGRAEVPTDR